MADYGIPYMGSKDGICDDLIKIFPNAENFYDLFGGGFSVTHAMLLRRSKHYSNFHFNEIRPGICELIQSAIAGDYNYSKFKPEFIDRETFFKRVETDAYVKMIWSFGNNGKDYLFSKEIEPYKKSMHNAIVFNEFDELAKKTLGCEKFKDGYSIKDKRLLLRNKIEYYRKTKSPDFLYPFLNESQKEQIKEKGRFDYTGSFQLQQLQQLLRLERLQRLERLPKLSFTNLSYEQVEIKPNSVIYCDPPYTGTADYDGGFNTKKFLDWASEQKNPVFISEYEIKDDRFKAVFKIEKRSMLSVDKSVGNKTERVYANPAAQEKLKESLKSIAK